MPLFRRNRTDAEPRPARAPRVRVRLDPAERKAADRLQPREQQIGFGLAIFTTAVMVAAAIFEPAVRDKRPLYALMGVAVGAGFSLSLLLKNRSIASIGAYFALFPSFYSPATKGIILILVPLVGYAVWLLMKRTSATQAALRAKAAGATADSEATSGASAAGSASSDAARLKAAASSRYTPPKAKPAPGRRGR